VQNVTQGLGLGQVLWNELETGFFIYQGVKSAVKRLEFISDRILYIPLRGHLVNTVMNLWVP